MKNNNTNLFYINTILIVIVSLINNLIFSQTTFVESQNIPSTFPSSAELVDLDNDNDLDLIRTFLASTGLSSLNANEIWLNDGLGNFTLHQSFGNSESNDLAVGDLDDDGDIDIFVVNATYYPSQPDVTSNKVWLNDGLGNFTSNGQSLGVGISNGVALADIDNDNDLDAYVGNSGANTVWINDGTGQFTNSSQYLGSYPSEDVAAVDIDDDNDVDIITANCCINLGDHANRVWLNNGTGIFQNNQAIGNTSTNKLSIADIDGDLDPDVVFSNTFDDSKTYINDGNGNFSFHSNILSLSVAQRKTIKFSDIDNDGDNDMIATIFSSIYENRIFINDGSGNFTEDFQLTILNTTDVAIGDIDNDGDKDIFLLNVNDQNSEFWLNQLITLSTDLNNNDNPEFKVYPNPFIENFTVDLGKPYENIFVNIFNLEGQNIYNQSFSSTRQIHLDLKRPKGIYFIQIELNKKTRSIVKLIKK